MTWIEEVEARAILNDGKGDLARALRIIKRLRETIKNIDGICCGCGAGHAEAVEALEYDGEG